MTIIVSVSVVFIAVPLIWLLFGEPPGFFRYLFLAGILALLACGIYTVLTYAGT